MSSDLSPFYWSTSFKNTTVTDLRNNNNIKIGKKEQELKPVKDKIFNDNLLKPIYSRSEDESYYSFNNGNYTFNRIINNLPIETSVIEANNNIGIDGGINIPNVPDAAIRPYVNLLSYPLLIIGGPATIDMLAAFATELPVILAPIAHVITVETARPPGKWPTHFVTVSNNNSVTFAFRRISLININIGIAVKRKELFDSNIV